MGDCSLWEYMFPTSDKPLLSIPDPDEDLDLDDEDEEEETEKHLDIPPSWCEPITVTYKGKWLRSNNYTCSLESSSFLS